MRHYHWKTGKPCNCTFGPRIIQSKTASKLDWLRERPDMQTHEAQQWLNHLDIHHPHADPLYPWLTREMKRGRLNFDAQQYGNNNIRIPEMGAPPGGILTPGTTRHWMDWFNSNHPTRQGVNIDSKQFQVPQMMERVNAWDEAMRQEAENAQIQQQNNAPILHQYPDGWTLRRLRPEHLDYEGECMGHCVGGWGYQDKVGNGETVIASLRDPRGEPHATMELTPQHEGKEPRLDLERALSQHPVARALPEDIKNELRSFHDKGYAPNRGPTGQDVQNLYYQLYRDPNYHEPYNPPLDNAEIVQIQGKGNQVPNPEYQQRLKEWFQTFPEATRPNWNESPDEIRHIGALVPDAETYAPSWDGVVHGDPDADDGGVGGGYGSHGDYGLVQPQRSIWYPSVVDSLLRPRSYHDWRDESNQRHDPAEVKTLYEEALKRQEIPELARAVSDYGQGAQDDFDKLMDMNYDYLGAFPGESREDFDWDQPGRLEEHYNQENHPDSISDLPPEKREGKLQDYWQELHDRYRMGEEELYNEHAPTQLTNELYKYINPHFIGGKQEWSNEIQPKKESPQSGELAGPTGSTFSRVARGRKPHRNRHGNSCYCPFGIDGKMARRVQASKLDWLRERPDMRTPEGQKALGVLQKMMFTLDSEKDKRAADKTFPWLIRELNKGRLAYPHGHDDPAYFSIGGAYGGPLDGEKAAQVGHYLDEQKKQGNGIDLMQQQARELLPEVNAWQELKSEMEDPEEWRQGLGEIVHQWPDGWSIRRLQDAEEAEQEGEDMGNCVGTEQYGYPQAIESGNMRVYSLRSPGNKPHATIAIDPDGSVEQIEDRSGRFGEKYRNKVNQWMAQAGDLSFEGNGKQTRWWDDYYEREGPQNFRELVGFNGDDSQFDLPGYPQEEWYEGEPDEYRNAISDADEMGVPWDEQPDLRVDNPDYGKILQSLLWDEGGHRHGPNGYQQYPARNLPYNPEWGQYVLDHAVTNNHEGDLRYALEEQYEDPDEDWRFQHDPHTIPTPEQRDQEARHYRDLLQDPQAQMVNHLMPQVNPAWQSLGPPAQIHPEQQQMFQERLPYRPGDDPDLGPFQYKYPQYNQPGTTFSKVASPLYYRFVFSPISGEVDLSHNADPTPRLHGEMAAQRNEPGLVHGFAYRIGGGWRLFDWEHKPLEDPFVIAQVMRKLRNEQEESQEDDWAPEPDFDRLHHGIPT